MTQFGVLGQLTIHRDGSPVRLNAPMLRQLLAVLLADANHPVSINTIVAALWGETAPGGARKTVQIYVHRLRQVLGDGLIVQSPNGYQLSVDPNDIDAERFVSLAGQARANRSIELFDQALTLWRGPAYEDLADRPPVLDAARRLDEERVRVTSEHIELRLAAGHHEELIPQLVALTEHHPYREDLCAHLMLALYRTGRQVDALEAYRRVREELAHELGLEPGPPLRRMHESILRSAPELELAQAPNARTVIPRELPSAPAGFAGRSAQLSALDGILVAGAGPVPIALISGSGGVGKTALALQWAQLTANRFPDGQLFMDLRGYASSAPRVRPIEALASLLRSLGVPPRQIPIDVAEAAALYRSRMAGRKALVVLDNARSSEEVRALLPGASGCAVVVTSRDRLSGLIALDGATRVPLDVLTSQEAETLIARLIGTPGRASSFAALAESCGHLPLALRVAIAYLLDHPHQTVDGLVAKLRVGQRLGTLALIGDDSAAVRNTFALSYRSVPPEAQLVFRRLGIAPCHDFTAPSAAALADIAEELAEDLLERLADAHLIGAGSADRYSIHDLLREFAAERCHAEESPADQDRAIESLRQMYLDFADAAAEAAYANVFRMPWKSSARMRFLEPSQALDWLDVENNNVVDVIREAAAKGSSAAWILASQLRGYFDLRRHVQPWLNSGRAGLWAARKAGDERCQAAMFQLLGHAYGATGRHAISARYSERSAEFARRAGWADGYALSMGHLGILRGMAGEPRAATRLFHEAVQTWRELDSESLAGKSLNNLATAHCQMGNLRQALSFAREASESQVLPIDRSQVSAPIHGKVLCLLGDYESGINVLRVAITLLGSLGHSGRETYAGCYLSRS